MSQISGSAENTEAQDLFVFFNFRSPYCYLLSKRLGALLEQYRVTLQWRPLGGWNGRSAPERAKVKVPLTRQDVQRWCRKLGIPFAPPPVTTDPTRAGAASLWAQRQGCLLEYIVEIMRLEWAEGQDIGSTEVLAELARRIGQTASELLAAADQPENHQILEQNAQEAKEKGVFGVPTFIIGDAIFWGNDRLDFLEDHLRSLALRRI